MNYEVPDVKFSPTKKKATPIRVKANRLKKKLLKSSLSSSTKKKSSSKPQIVDRTLAEDDADISVSVSESSSISAASSSWREYTSQFLQNLRHFSTVLFGVPAGIPACLNGDISLHGAAEAIRSGQCRKILVLTGSGISASSGLPCLKSPDEQLLKHLETFPDPYDILTEDTVRRRSEAFLYFMRQMLRPGAAPSVVHRFLRLLSDRHILLRNYTQNFDMLENKVLLPQNRLVRAHGALEQAHCLDCHVKIDIALYRTLVFKNEFPECAKCGGVLSPQITLFNEAIPSHTFSRVDHDFSVCDMLIIIGTSLNTLPFANFLRMVRPSTPRLLFNFTKVGMNEQDDPFPLAGAFGTRTGDIFIPGDCNESIVTFSTLCGFGENALVDDSK